MVANINVVKLSDILLKWFTTQGIKILISIIILFIGWKIINKGLKTLKVFLEKKNVDPTLTSFFHAFADIALKILLVICIAGYLGAKTTSFAAIIASAGLAVGLALQGSLSNFAGGVIILLLRPFNVGDFIEATPSSGKVEKISIFYTHIISGDNKEIMIPNGKLINGTVTNYSSKDLRRVDLTITTAYDVDLLKVKSILQELVDNHPLVLKDPKPFVGLLEQAASALTFTVKGWCKAEDYWTIHFNILEEAKLRFDREDISNGKS